jgi:hypothetical protein
MMSRTVDIGRVEHDDIGAFRPKGRQTKIGAYRRSGGDIGRYQREPSRIGPPPEEALTIGQVDDPGSIRNIAGGHRRNQRRVGSPMDRL